jgi:UDP-glucose 4-epimerase
MHLKSGLTGFVLNNVRTLKKGRRKKATPGRDVPECILFDCKEGWFLRISSTMKIFVTGGTGYIGSHTVVELLEAGHEVVLFDNLVNSSPVVLERIEQISGTAPEFIEGDIRDAALLRETFAAAGFDAVIHFAGLKAVGESVQKPLAYYENNVGGSITLYQEMARAGIFRLVFSSSATVYGDPESVPIHEDTKTGDLTNPYGWTKLMNEQICRDMAVADNRWSVALLRYFNPVGAHSSGLIGENPNGIPNNLVPFIAQVAVGRLKELSVFGNDWPTPDGTGVRDYIHVTDLAKGHLKALEKIVGATGSNVWNLGTGQGYSVLEMIAAFEKASGKKVPYRVVSRRGGDIAACWADPVKAEKDLGWKAELDLDAMMRDTWRWQSINPAGYESK